MRGQLDTATSPGVWIIRTEFYNASGGVLADIDAASGSASGLTSEWQRKGERITSPSGAVSMRIGLYNWTMSGWVAYDDITVNQTISRSYYYAGPTRIAMRTGNGTGPDGLTWLLSDHLGSTSVSVDAATGTKLAELRYKPWGEIRFISGVMPTTYGYTGQRHESDLGLYFYNSRFYDPALGHFVSPDDIIPDQNNPQDWDHYAYVRNSPINHNDPTGHCIDPDGQHCPVKQTTVLTNSAISPVNKLETNDSLLYFSGTEYSKKAEDGYTDFSTSGSTPGAAFVDFPGALNDGLEWIRDNTDIRRGFPFYNSTVSGEVYLEPVAAGGLHFTGASINNQGTNTIKIDIIYGRVYSTGSGNNHSKWEKLYSPSSNSPNTGVAFPGTQSSTVPLPACVKIYPGQTAEFRINVSTSNSMYANLTASAINPAP